MLLTTALLLAMTASAQPARLPRDEPNTGLNRWHSDTGFQIYNGKRCVTVYQNLQANEAVVAEDCTGSTFLGWNMNGGAMGNTNHIRVANTNLCLSAGTDSKQWANGLRLTLQQCNPSSDSETFINTQRWRKSPAEGLGEFRLMKQQTAHPYGFVETEWCMDVRDGWKPSEYGQWEMQLWRCSNNSNQRYTDNWEEGPAS